MALNRGLTPTLTEGRLEFVGDTAESLFKLLTPPLLAAVELHRPALTRLVALEWVPDQVGLGGMVIPGSRPPLAPGQAQESAVAPAGPRAFDHDAERLLRDLYAIDYGMRPDGKGGWGVFPAVGSVRLDQWRKRAGKLRDRLIAHLTPPPSTTPEAAALCKAQGIKVSPQVAIEFLKEGAVMNPLHGPRDHVYVHVWPEAHPFALPCPTQFSHWRFLGEEYWRAPWGVYRDLGAEVSGGDRMNHHRTWRVLSWCPYGWRPKREAVPDGEA